MSKYDIFDSPYYRIQNVYWRLLGFWPLDKHKLIKRAIVIIIIISLIIPMAIKLVEELKRDLDVVLEITGYIIYLSACLIKYLSYLHSEEQMMFLFNKIANDWTIITYEDEIQKLKKYGLAGRQLTKLYMLVLNVTLVIYLLVPLSPILLDVIMPLNETRSRSLPYFAEYFVDEQAYYFQLTVHAWIGIILTVQIFCAFDTTYACCTQHACALFTIVESRMWRAAKIASSSKYLDKKKRDEDEYNSMRAAIILHKEAIQFIDEIEKSYSLIFFVVVTLNSAIITLAAVVVLMSLEKGNMKKLTRFIANYIGFSVHMLFNMLPSQEVIDHSTSVQNAVYNCEWYNISPRSSKLLRMAMLRSLRPCAFTGKKLIELNLESFSSVFRNTMSYITVVASMR